MTGIEIGGMIVGVIGAVATVYKILDNKTKELHDEIHSVKDKLHELELKSVAGDELTKKHILNCRNFDPRHNIDK